MDTGVLGAMEDQQNTRSFHQQLDGAVEDYPGIQFKANFPSSHQMLHIPRTCPTPPLLFCIRLNPLSQIIRKVSIGYRLRNGTTIVHLRYMVDIKLERINSLFLITRKYRNDDMSLRLL